MNTCARVCGLGILAATFGLALMLTTCNSSMAAAPGQSGQGQHFDPEIHRALHTLHEARHELEHARHDFDGHREAALHSVDEAIHQLETCLKTTHNGASSNSNSNASQWRQAHGRLTSGS